MSRAIVFLNSSVGKKIVMAVTGIVLSLFVFGTVELIKPNFIFAGGDKTLAEIASAEPNQLLKITGYTQYGSRWVLVQTVEKSAPITGPTPTSRSRCASKVI